ncbi:hypothetical protein Mapa_004758 [Marchantia paleacea]|nr:hypothetical protein Mapa_004758 [Marchantia paleacea]
MPPKSSAKTCAYSSFCRPTGNGRRTGWGGGRVCCLEDGRAECSTWKETSPPFARSKRGCDQNSPSPPLLLPRPSTPAAPFPPKTSAHLLLERNPQTWPCRPSCREMRTDRE